MKEAEKLRVGIVGCGYQGGRLAHAIGLVDSLQVTACADIIPERAIKLAGTVGVASAHDCAEDLLANSQVDIVMVATPHHVLAPISLLAIRAGKHVLAEKPCGMSAADLAEVELAAAHAEVSYLAGYSFRYIPGWYRVHELLQQGVVGQIQAITGAIGVGPMDEGWKAHPETGGGPLMYVGSHLIDQVLWYLQDDPVEVYAATHFRQDTRADETSSFQVRFAHGATAQLISTQTVRGGLVSWLEIIGQSGSIRMNVCSGMEYELIVTSTLVPEYTQPVTMRVKPDNDFRNVMHCQQFNEYVAAIRAEQATFTTAGDARKVLQVIDAIFASSRSHQPVTIRQVSAINV